MELREKGWVLGITKPFERGPKRFRAGRAAVGPKALCAGARETAERRGGRSESAGGWDESGGELGKFGVFGVLFLASTALLLFFLASTAVFF